MFTRSSFRNLKHKAKKSVMLKIGKTESSQEDPAFKKLLVKIDLVKSELRNMQKISRSVIVTGEQYNDNLEKFCGVGLKGENLFNNEAVFLQVLEESVCPALSTIINKDLEQLSDLIVEYKTAKLKYDAAHFKAVKDIKKKKVDVSAENVDEVMEVDTNLPDLKDLYIESKRKVIRERDAFLDRLNTITAKSLKELRESSDSQHHQLYCQYFKDKLMKMSQICADGTTDAIPGNGNFSYSENEIVAGLLVDDEKRTSQEIETVDAEFEFTKKSPIETTYNSGNPFVSVEAGQNNTTVKTNTDDLNGVDQSAFAEVKNTEVICPPLPAKKPPREPLGNDKSPLQINNVYSNRSRSPTRKNSL